MSSPRRIPAAALVLTVATIVGGGLVGGTGPAAAAGPAPAAEVGTSSNAPVEVLVDGIDPVVPHRGSVLVVTGHLVPPAGAGTHGLSVRLALGAALGSRQELHDARTRERELTPLGPTFPVDAQLHFSARLPLPVRPLGGNGVYPMQVLAEGKGNAGQSELGRTTTFLPWFPDPVAQPVPLGWAWPVLDQPRHVRSAMLLDPTLAAEVAPEGRLDSLLAAAAAVPQAKVTPLLDPGLLDELDRLAQAGSPATAAVVANAQRQLARLRSLAGRVAPVVLPYGNVDVSALVAGGRPEEVRAAIHRFGIPRATAILHTEPDAQLGMPPEGCAGPPGLTELAANGISAMVLSEVCLPVDPALTYTPTARTRVLVSGRPVNALVADATLSVMAAVGSAAATTGRLAEQSFLAETAMIAMEQPGVRRPTVVAPPVYWSPSDSWARQLLADSSGAPWIRPATLSELLATPEAARGQPTGAGDSAALSSGYLADVAAVRQRLQGVCSMLSAPQECLSEPQLLQAESAAWRFRPDQGELFLDGLRQVATSTENGVRVAASPVVTLTSRSGRVPVTLENSLSQDVTVRLVLEASDRSRISSAASLVRTLRPGQKVQVEVKVEAQSAGRFPVDLRLLTPAGTPVGQPIRIVVRSTVYGVVAVAITVGALAVLFLLVLVRGLGRLRRRGRGRQGPPAPPGAGSSPDEGEYPVHLPKDSATVTTREGASLGPSQLGPAAAGAPPAQAAERAT